MQRITQETVENWPRELGDFAGAWAVSRRVDDRLAGQVVQAEGQVVLKPGDGGDLIYDEVLSLHIPGRAAMKATRRYLWRSDDEGIRVCFDDGRFFHRITLGAAESADTHDCPPDLYAGRYDFSRWPHWSAEWKVSGPRKDYVMTTVFMR